MDNEIVRAGRKGRYEIMTYDSFHVGRKVKELRTDRGMNLDELAEAVDCSTAHLNIGRRLTPDSLIR